ncbi:MAG: mismatch-specific DNA-glycosylase [Phototrophicaceae bacterium]
MILPDALQSDLNLVFCGTAASAISAAENAYYANPANAFWRTLYHIGLTPHQLDPKEFSQLLTYRIGLTDVAKDTSGNDADLQQSDFDAENLRNKIMHYQPQILAFTSKKGASVVLDKATSKIDYGQQVETLNQSLIWVLPSPSGAARRYWDISIWQALADKVGNLPER